MKKSEKLLLNEIFTATKNVEKLQQDLSIGQLIFLIRKQLRISQRTLSKKSQIPQSTISRIEAGILNPTIKTLNKIFSTLSCKLVITAFAYEDFEDICKKQAHKKAKKNLNNKMTEFI